MVGKVIGSSQSGMVLDVATGPGKVARRLATRGPATVVGLDITAPMLERAREAVASAGLAGRILLVRASGDELPFRDSTFSALTFAYLLRYVRDPPATLRELSRVVRPGGVLASLEFAVPPSPGWRLAWRLYTRAILPTAGLLAGGRPWWEVGRFLGPSITEHYERYPLDRTVAMWEAAGLEEVGVTQMSLGGGVVTWGRKAGSDEKAGG